MKKFFKLAVLIVSSILLVGCSNSGKRTEDVEVKATEPVTMIAVKVNTADEKKTDAKTEDTSTVISTTTMVTTETTTTLAETKIVTTTDVATTTTVSNANQVEATTQNVSLDYTNNESYSNDVNSTYATYVVQDGDTLSAIAGAYGCSMYDIKDEYGNYLSSFDIYVGQNLMVPYGSYDYNETNNDNYSNNYSDDSSFSNSGWSDGMVWNNSVTLYTSAGENSWYNIQLVSNILNAGSWNNYYNGIYSNGYVVGPCETFSFFDVMGPCYGWQGFKSGAAYTYNPNTGEVDTIDVEGGGICFPSTTIFQAATGAGCIPIEWHDHIGPVTYASPGNEAAISYEDGQDMQFYNPSATDSLRITMDTSSWGYCTVYITVE